MSKPRYPLAVAVAGFTLALTGCFGGSSSSSSSSDTQDPETGVPEVSEPVEISTDNVMTPTGELEGQQSGTLQDAAVEGLTYWTASAGSQQMSQTGEGGSFEFEPGEIVVFRLGGERLVTTDAELISTPLDTLSLERVISGTDGEGHPAEALNILRLLQSIDQAPEDDTRVVIPDLFHNDQTSFEDGQFTVTVEPDEFPFTYAIDPILTLAGVNPDAESMVSPEDASSHFAQSLSRLDDADFDMRGEWRISSMHLNSFEATDPKPGCELKERSTLIIDDTTGFQFGEELDSSSDGCEEVTFGESDEDADGVVTRDGNTGVEWSLAESGIIDVECGPICSLSELRSTTNDWDAMCLRDSFPYGENQSWSFDDLAYCAESDNHNGPIMAFSEVSFVDRLGGDRLIRMKRDFSANTQYAPANPDTERAESFSEQGFFLSVYDRAETADYTLDLTEGQWEESVMPIDGGLVIENEPVDFNETANAPLHMPECEDISACTWAELNQVVENYDEQTGDSLNFIHVRGTNVINWSIDNFAGTIKRVD